MPPRMVLIPNIPSSTTSRRSLTVLIDSDIFADVLITANGQAYI